MNVDYSNLSDFAAWISLAREVEPLFGPMADEAPFQEAIRDAISEKRAFCIRASADEKDASLSGGVVISEEANEIVWLAVAERCRGMGFGRQLLKFAINRLNPHKSIFVQTFDQSVPEGTAARHLYLESGFTDLKDGGPNPAGIPTVIMQLPATPGNPV
mgnify:FL=1